MAKTIKPDPKPIPARESNSPSTKGIQVPNRPQTTQPNSPSKKK